MLPLPVYVLAGAFLSVASNYDKEIGTFWKQRDNRAETLSQTAILDDSKAVLAAKQDSLTALEGNQE